ncbi:pilus assembly protein TadG-related protein [Aeromicrobium piscarium]|uniref:Putative Flp pilus-assembly TadG-like N-terminal domain-containing protein n=1 Tax=Aeromicrobium piscarium TaxID=2590901 RepID=A0A554SGP6_9ACTN|nr:pilus assembly protein TadG-related protein [Aeromicrobium piscarium]TSD65525.1 hypothetical protein FNM00_03610 [Aeromicrobium piscarium]
MTSHERGAASVFVVGMSVVLLLCAGLAIDGGVGINTRMRVADDAEQAARAGANAVDVGRLRSSGVVAIDPVQARQAAAGFLAGRGYSAGQYSVSVDGTEVSVDVRDSTDTIILSIINIDSYPVSAGATAVAAMN